MIVYWIIKIVLFLLNFVFIIKRMNPELKGMIFQYEFYHQFFILETIRNTCKRSNEKESLNLLIIFYYPICFIILLIIYFQSSLIYMKYYIFILLLEILSETLFNLLILKKFDIQYKWLNESFSLFLKSIYLLSCKEMNIENYIQSCFIYYILLFTNYFILYFQYFNFQFQISYQIFYSFSHYFFISFLKLFLTNGEKYVLYYYYSLKDQGIYEVSMNLGGFIPRMILLPIEEYLSIEFLKDHKMELFQKYFKRLFIFSLFFICYGYFYTNDLILFIYGNQWKDVPILLSWFCIYIPFLSMNGISESFLYSNIQNHQLKSNQLFMILFNIIYFLSIYILIFYLSLPIQSLIICNIINLSSRIIYSFYFIISNYHFHFNIHINILLSFLFIWFFNYNYHSILFNLFYFIGHLFIIYIYQ